MGEEKKEEAPELTEEQKLAQEEEREKKRTERHEKKAVKVRKKCSTRPLILKGWIIEVEEFGKGEVVDFQPGGLGSSTKMKVAFEEGVRWVALDRKEAGKTGRYPFDIVAKSGAQF